MNCTARSLKAIQAAGQDFEWYPTTQRMIDIVAKQIPTDAKSILDIGAGDGRVLIQLGKRCQSPELFAIEKSPILVQSQPEGVTPVGTDLFEQNLACLPVDYIFCNPPYSEFEQWTDIIIQSGFARKAFVVIPRRWKNSAALSASLTKRGATAQVIHSDDFLDAERSARAIVDIVEIRYPRKNDYESSVEDPFDIWFDQNISTFDQESPVKDDDAGRDISKLGSLETIAALVDAYNEEYSRMEENYRAIFRLDYALLRELSVSKQVVRDGIKKKMAGLKSKYWQLLFERLNTITSRLSTATKKRFLERLAGRTAIAFTANNAYAVVLWAIKHANKYFDEQVITLYRRISTFDGVLNYKSNQRTWQKDGWRYRAEDHSHYALDYRIVVENWRAIRTEEFRHFEYTGELHRECHEMIDDIIAVFGNLGYAVSDVASRVRHWASGTWQDFHLGSGDVLFQVKAFKNGNLHLRFTPESMKNLNVEAGRLLGWLRNSADVVSELGYSADEAEKYFHSSHQILPSSMKLLAGVTA